MLTNGEIGEIVGKRINYREGASMSRVIFHERESKLLEFKSIVPKLDMLIKTAVSFANGAGGRIIIGVDDITHEVIGISNEDRLKIYDDFPNSLYDSVSPTLVAQIYEQNLGDNSVLIIEIPASPKKPYFIKSKGVSNGTYVRVGTSTRKANQENIEDLVREAQRISYDEEILFCDITVLSKELLHEFYGTHVTKKRLLIDKIIGRKPANRESFSPTVAGILMFAESPQEYIHEALIKCTRFQGTEGREIIYTTDIVGTLEQQANECLKVITAWLSSNYMLQGAKLIGQIPIPSDALREAIVNALLHRKYSIPGAVKVAMYDDRVEVFSPGGFPGLVDINSLGDGTTYLRNPTLARLAYQIRLIETRGTGIRLIYESCKKAGIKMPVYHEEGDFVKVIFYFEPDIKQYDTEAEAVIAYIKMRQIVTAQQVADFLLVSRNTAIRKLNQYAKQGWVKKQGRGPSVKYSLF